MRVLFLVSENYIGSMCYHIANEYGLDVVVYSYAQQPVSVPAAVAVYHTKQHSLTTVLQRHAIDCVVNTLIVEPTLYPHFTEIHEHILQCMIHANIRNTVVFSSAEIYGAPVSDFVNEEQRHAPLSEKGNKALILEQQLQQYSNAYPNMKITVLRLFSVAGADNSFSIGPAYDSTAFFPSVLRAMINTKYKFVFNGNDYATQDGYQIRDFIDVHDVATGCIKAIQLLSQQPIPLLEYNLGSGISYSLQELVQITSRMLQKKIYTTVQPRKENSIARLVSDTARIKLLLQWSPAYPIETTIQDMWFWFTRRL